MLEVTVWSSHIWLTTAFKKILKHSPRIDFQDALFKLPQLQLSVPSAFTPYQPDKAKCIRTKASTISTAASAATNPGLLNISAIPRMINYEVNTITATTAAENRQSEVIEKNDVLPLIYINFEDLQVMAHVDNVSSSSIISKPLVDQLKLATVESPFDKVSVQLLSDKHIIPAIHTQASFTINGETLVFDNSFLVAESPRYQMVLGHDFLSNIMSP